ncbi:hydroxymethylglutaryl-CoA reductase (NADPH) [Candidatus Woesearchaeota archaeon]|nr:hydroxymethylglutaryl-CoA reductase (NADPH) [Candidatus Woesearchaeota archaeon]
MATNSSLSDKEIIGKLVNKEIKFYEIDDLVGETRASKIRLCAIQKILNINLPTISSYSISPENCKSNIENMIGAAQVPIGIAGPIKINGEFAKGEFFLPLATTEGALVASINRGCSLISKSGGATACILKSAQTRSLLFKAKSVKYTKRFVLWVEKNYNKLKEIAESTSNHLALIRIKPYVVSTNIWLRLEADTGEAMGMNMLTIAGKEVGDYIEKEVDFIEFVSESGNLCVDKKPAAINLFEGRGKSVLAEVLIEKDIVEKYLKTSPENIVDLNYRKNYLGSALAGSLGYNAHFANTVAAMYLAAGQDMAHVVEGSLGLTTAEIQEDKLYFSITLPCLQVGVIGGGTRIETQKECLKILGVDQATENGSNSKKLAEIIAAAVLAGELSLLGAQAAGHLAKAHKRLNR